MPSDLPPATPLPAALPAWRGLPVLAGMFAAAAFVSMDSVIKLMAPRYDALQLSFFRFAGGSVFAVLLWLWHRSPLPTGAAWRLHFTRTLFLLVSLVGYFHALTILPLVQAVTISYLAPIFVSVLAIPVLKERPAGPVWWALAMGLIGVSVSMVPELRASLAGTDPSRLLGIASAAVAAFSFAFVMLLSRRQARIDSPWTILLVQNLLALFALTAPAALTWKPMAPADFALVGLAGALGTVGLLSLNYAFTHLEASRVAPLEYSSFVWAAVLGYLLFGEVPTASTAFSALLIVAGCLLVVRR